MGSLVTFFVIAFFALLINESKFIIENSLKFTEVKLRIKDSIIVLRAHEHGHRSRLISCKGKLVPQT